jgi:mRNA interferase HigB
MNIFHYKQIAFFIKKHNQARVPLLVIYQTLKEGEFRDSKEIIDRFPRSSVIKGKKNRIVFRFKGNNYRMIIKFDYSRQIGNILFVGTHAEYDKE